MKIIQLTTYFHPSVGGVERQAEEIAYHLGGLGHEVEVFTTDATHGREKRMQRLGDNYRGLKITRFRYLFGLGNFLRFAPGLIWKLWRADFDILHVHNVHDGHLLPALLVKSLRHKKLVLTGHNPFIVGAEKRGEKLNRGVAFYEWVLGLRVFRSKIDLYIALLESEKQTVMQRFRLPSEKVVVIPNGIQDLYYENDGSAESFYQEWEINPQDWDLIVGTASRLNFVKGLQNLQYAVRDLPRVLFVFVGGDDGYGENLRKMYAKYPNVIFTEHYLPSEELKNFYRAIDLFLLPSVYEPFGMTVVEAMAQGKLVLATNNGGPPEILPQGTGEVLDPADQQLWKERIAYYAEHKHEINIRGEVSRSLAGAYTWGHVISQIDEAYRGISDKKLSA
ncbi:glycosyltransferase family 4 protein [Candidatus Dojkabacteria bacterium]|uniref:Glycosyltransferase family 4 protein n=1 Tax=Candidatus Dojkabacteria bacterium TaxID=2099670 RepID=A0A955KZL2_9BACT|nr:glycosyltransferase family 4 protein [Candidatus Dojkabacteria bacterium]